MELLALRLGYRPLEWEHLQPVELFALEEAQHWRRCREWEMTTLAIAWLRIGFVETDMEAMRKSLAGYEEERHGPR